MKELQDKILRDGKTIGTEIVKVDMFLNHMLDIKLMDDMGEEIKRLFNEENPNKILTVEASGIPIAVSASRAFGYIPVVFAKKTKPSTMIDDAYTAEARSFTKGTTSVLRVAKDFLGEGDRILIIDDFLAAGQAGMALCDIVEQAGGKVVGFCAAIEKKHQGGADLLRSRGIPVKNLAIIDHIEDGRIIFED
jgi:xanthine phosphoribosyltransferase